MECWSVKHRISHAQLVLFEGVVGAPLLGDDGDVLLDLQLGLDAVEDELHDPLVHGVEPEHVLVERDLLSCELPGVVSEDGREVGHPPHDLELERVVLLEHEDHVDHPLRVPFQEQGQPIVRSPELRVISILPCLKEELEQHVISWGIGQWKRSDLEAVHHTDASVDDSSEELSSLDEVRIEVGQVASEVLVAHDDGVLVEEAVDGPDVLLVDLLRVAHLVKELWILLDLPLGVDDAVQLLLHLLEEVVWECRPLGVFGLFRRLHLKNFNGHLNGALNSRSRVSEQRGGDLHRASERPTRGQH